MVVRNGTRLLDQIGEVLVSDPAASLAQIAEAVGIGRTTLHKQYATRDELTAAVAHRVLDLFEAAIASVPAGSPDEDFAALVDALVPIGAPLAFLWRTPSFDHDADINARWIAVESSAFAVLARVQAAGVLKPGATGDWMVSTLYALVYSASVLVHAGRLAPLDAPKLVTDTYLHGLS